MCSFVVLGSCLQVSWSRTRGASKPLTGGLGLDLAGCGLGHGLGLGNSSLGLCLEVCSLALFLKSSLDSTLHYISHFFVVSN